VWNQTRIATFSLRGRLQNLAIFSSSHIGLRKWFIFSIRIVATFPINTEKNHWQKLLHWMISSHRYKFQPEPSLNIMLIFCWNIELFFRSSKRRGWAIVKYIEFVISLYTRFTTKKNIYNSFHLTPILRNAQQFSGHALFQLHFK